MSESPGFFWTVLSFAFVIGPLIFVHELGHYLVGRACGVKAESFSIGFGRELFGWTDRRGTRWKVSLLPLGGYVKFAGDMNAGSAPDPEWLALPEAERRRTFQAKALWQRFLIVAAGPVTNFLFSFVAFMAIFAFFFNGEPRTPPVVTSVVASSAAAKAGIRPGDRVTMIAGQGVDRFEDIAEIVRIRPGEALNMDIYRGRTQVHLTVTPDVDIQKDNFGNVARLGLLGVATTARVVAPLAWYELPGASLRQMDTSLRTMVAGLWQIVSGWRSVRELSGPVGMAKFAGQQATLGGWAFLWFMAFVSMNLGFINLLPIPMLDGGHLLFYIFEGIRRRPVNPQVQEWAFRSGLALLLAFMLFVTFNDLGSFGIWQRIAGLIG